MTTADSAARRTREELAAALEIAELALQAMLDTWLDYHDAHSLTKPVTGASGNAFDKALVARDGAHAALARYRDESDG